MDAATLVLFLCMIGESCLSEMIRPMHPGAKDVETEESRGPPALILRDKVDSNCLAGTGGEVPAEVRTETKTVVKEVVVEINETDGGNQEDVQAVAPYRSLGGLGTDCKKDLAVSQVSRKDVVNVSGTGDRCYILMMDSHSGNICEVASLIESSGGRVKKRYSKNMVGLSFCSEDEEVYRKVKDEYVYATVEEDQVYRTSSIQNNIPNHMYLMKYYENMVFNNYLYDNLGFRLLQIKRVLRRFFGFYEYHYTGRNVQIFLLDTTVDTVSGNIRNMSGASESCNRHGNIMAGLLVGKTHGFAKDSRVSVLDVVGCNGVVLLSDIIHVLEEVERSEAPRILVFGVSGQYSRILNSVVDTISNNNVVVVAPAGNFHDQSCSYSPGSARSVISVGSVDKYARISKFSNYGDCVRMFALGEDLLEEGDGAGTSFSAAIVASAVAIFLEKSPRSSFVQVWKYLNQNSFWNDKGSYSTLRLPYLGTEGRYAGGWLLSDLSEIQENLVTYVFILSMALGTAYLIFLAVRYVRRRRRKDELLFDVPVNRF